MQPFVRPLGMSIARGMRGMLVLTTLNQGCKRVVEELFDGIAWVATAL